MMIKKSTKIWLDGKMIPWEEANVHVLTHTLSYGVAVFEGIRYYEGSDGRTAIFRLPEHLQRLFNSAKILTLKIPFSFDEILNACKEVVRVNGLKSGYFRPLAFLGDGEMGIYTDKNPVRVAIATWGWGAYLGEEGMKKGIRAKISSFTRHHVNSTLNKAKASANYINSFLAKQEVKQMGFDEALLLDTEGYVVEGSGENIFIVRNGRVKTPPSGSSILEGITAKSVCSLLEDLKVPVDFEKFARDELYLADEVFLTGTAAEVAPVREIDGRMIGEGCPGPLTQKVQELFFKAVRGDIPKYRDWLQTI